MSKKLHIFFALFVFITLPIIGLSQSRDSLKTVVAQKGEGIYKILRDNGYPPEKYYNKFLDLNKEKIKNDDSLIQGELYYLPPLKSDVKIGNTPIVKNDSICPIRLYQFADSIIGKELEGGVFYIISGHGGPDPGAVGDLDGKVISEDEYAYDICLRIAKNIEEQSGKVYMIIGDPNDSIRNDNYLPIDYDEFCYPDLEIPRDQLLRLKQRADAVNELYEENKSYKYQRVVEIHLDSRSTASGVDVFFYYYEPSTKGKILAESMQKIFNEKYIKYQPNRGYEGTVSARNLYVIRKVIPVALFIELGNIQNDRDRKRFFNPDNRQALAKWITEGFVEDFKNK